MEVYNAATKDIEEKSVIDEDIDKYYSNIITAIKKCASLAIPVSNPPKRPNPTPWWSKQCSTIIKQRNKAERKYMKTSDINDSIEYKRLKSIAQKTVRNAKNNNLKNVCTNLNYRTPTSKVWKKIKSITNSNINSNTSYPIENEAGILTNNPTEKCNLIANFFAKKLLDNNLNTEYRITSEQESLNESIKNTN